MAPKIHTDNKLRLDHPGLPYKPGDVVTGYLEVPARYDIQYIDLSFKGEAKVGLVHSEALDYKNTYYTAVLFSKTIQVVRDAQGKWTFAITIPAKVEQTPADSNTYNAPPGAEGIHFATNPEHDLPPTLPSISSSRAVRRVPRRASVEYSLRPTAAKYVFQDRTVPIIYPKVNLWVTKLCSPLGGAATLAPQTQLGQTSFQFPRKTILKTNPVRKVKKPPSDSDSLHHVDYRVAFTAPSSVDVDGAVGLDIVLQIPNLSDLGLSPDQVPVSLTWLKLSLEQICTTYDDVLTTFTKNSPPFKILKEAQAFDTDEWGNLTLNVPAANLPHPVIIPSFETFHISISYRLSIAATFRCNGEVRSCSATTPIRLLPKRRRPGDEGETEGFVEGPQDLNENWGSLVVAPSGELTGEQMVGAVMDVYTIVGTSLSLAGVACLCTIL